jgi:hypothetical protein
MIHISPILKIFSNSIEHHFQYDNGHLVFILFKNCFSTIKDYFQLVNDNFVFISFKQRFSASMKDHFQ